MRDGDEPRARAEQPRNSSSMQLAGVVHRDHTELRPGRFAGDLPGDDIGMMFQRRDDHFIARLEKCPTPLNGDKIDSFSRPAGEDDLGRPRALMKPAIVRRADSYASVATWLRW